MKNNLSLNLIFSHAQISGTETDFKVLYFFSDAGFVTKKMMEDILKTDYPGIDSSKIIFKSADDLGNFALKICRELKAPEVFLVPVTDFNLALEGVRDIRNFRDIYRRFGHMLVNPDFKKEKSSIFAKFFKE